MIPLADRPTPLARAILAEATRLFPNRRTASDGMLPSPAHVMQNPNSDHNDGHAVDVTHDPGNGCDIHKMANGVRGHCAAGQERRIAYIISNARIASPRSEWRWRAYTGSNPHTLHAHFSLVRGRADDTTALFTLLEEHEEDEDLMKHGDSALHIRAAKLTLNGVLNKFRDDDGKALDQDRKLIPPLGREYDDAMARLVRYLQVRVLGVDEAKTDGRKLHTAELVEMHRRAS
jgi:hypothetical protein